MDGQTSVFCSPMELNIRTDGFDGCLVQPSLRQKYGAEGAETALTPTPGSF
jgi:hypothetical protein